MDTSDPKISFDVDGICNHCTEFLKVRSLHSYHGKVSDEKLTQLISQIKDSGKGKKYDCVVGLSGGLDSSYTAYLAKEKGLRILGVHMDNGWDTHEAVLNIENIAKKLAIDYESYVLDWEEFKDLQLSFLKASTPEADTPTDIAILSALHKIAAKYKVKYILSGGNFATEGILPKYWHYNAKDTKYLLSIHHKYGTKKLKKFPLFGFIQETYFKLIKKIKIIYFLNYFPYEKKSAMAFLKKELDWKYTGGKHYESRYTSFIQSYYLFEKFGIDYRRATFSSQICAGIINRDQALEDIKPKPFDEQKIADDKIYISKKLDISIEEFERVLALNPKWYTDYHNDEKKLDFIYNLYRKLYKKEKLASF